MSLHAWIVYFIAVWLLQFLRQGYQHSQQKPLSFRVLVCSSVLFSLLTFTSCSQKDELCAISSFAVFYFMGRETSLSTDFSLYFLFCNALRNLAGNRLTYLLSPSRVVLSPEITLPTLRALWVWNNVSVATGRGLECVMKTSACPKMW